MKRKPKKLKPLKNNVVALGTRRQEQNRVLRKKYLTPEERLGELEADVFRLIEFSLELEERSTDTHNMVMRIFRLLQKRSNT